MNKFEVYKNVALRPFSATQMLWNHRRTLKYLWKNDRKSFYSHVFVTYLVRGEDCGKGVLDPIWKLTGWAPFLWDMEFEVTTRCYLKCIMCEHTYFPETYKNQDLSFDLFKKTLDNIPHLHWVNLTGEGSAFLNKDYFKMLEYCKKRGIYVDLSHDFFQYDDEMGRRLIELGIDRLYWSFDGCTKETYETVRVGSNYERVIENLKNFIALKREMDSPLPEICFRYCFFKHNIHEVPIIPDFLKSLVDDIKEFGDEPSVNIVALMEFEQTKDWVREIPSDVVEDVDKRLKDYGFQVYWSHVTHIEEEKAPADYCTFWSEPYTMVTGDVVCCCERMQTNIRKELEIYSFGNINNQPFRDIWYSEKYKKFRKTLVNPRTPIPKVCMGCRAFNTQERARRYGVE